MKNTSTEWQDLVVQIFHSKQYDFLFIVKSGETFLPRIKKACVSKLIPEPGIYKIRCTQYKDAQGYDALYIHKAIKHIPA